MMLFASGNHSRLASQVAQALFRLALREADIGEALIYPCSPRDVVSSSKYLRGTPRGMRIPTGGS